MRLQNTLTFPDASSQAIAAILYQSVAYALSITPNAALGPVVRVGTLTGNLTVNAPTSPQPGQRLLLLFTQDGTGGRTVTYDAVFLGTLAPVTLLAGASFASEFVYNGANWISTWNLPVATATVLGGVTQGANISIDGATGAIAVPTATTAAQGAVQLATPSADTTAGHVVQASDARLSDARTPASASITTKAQFGSAMAALQKASSNPGSPATNDTVFRTDKGRLAYYDGTRWLSDAPVPQPFMPMSTLQPFAATVDAWYAVPPNDLALYLERWTSVVKVNTTNNVSNFWTVTLQGADSAGTATTLDSFTTAARAANTLVFEDRALTTALTAAQYRYFVILVTKTGAPGTLVCLPHLRAREILT